MVKNTIKLSIVSLFTLSLVACGGYRETPPPKAEEGEASPLQSSKKSSVSSCSNLNLSGTWYIKSAETACKKSEAKKYKLTLAAKQGDDKKVVENTYVAKKKKIELTYELDTKSCVIKKSYKIKDKEKAVLYKITDLDAANDSSVQMILQNCESDVNILLGKDPCESLGTEVLHVIKKSE